MEATKIFAVAVLAFAMVSLGEGMAALQPVELPGCPFIPVVPDCRAPSVVSCVKGRNGCSLKCFCHVPCPELKCLQSTALECENGVKLDCNGCPTCECREPCQPCEPCRLTPKQCMMGIRYWINNDGCRKCRCID